MGGTLLFPIDDAFKAMVDQAVKANSPLKFVKDQGVYLLAFGAEVHQNKVCYALGFNPKVDDFDSWYDRAHRICGGDDFAGDMDMAIAAEAKRRARD